MLAYNRLKRDFISVCSTNVTELDFFKLRNYFESYLNSVRRLSYCSKLEDLIKLLEKADVLNEDDVSPLRQIVNILGNEYRHVLGYIYSYERLREREEPINQTIPTFSAPNNLNYVPKPNPRLQPVIINNSTSGDKAKDICFKIISESLGQKWKQMGRALSIPEGEMDSIYTMYQNDMCSQILEMLNRYENNPHYERRTLRTNLEKSLRKAGRADLALRIIDIFDRYS